MTRDSDSSAVAGTAVPGMRSSERRGIKKHAILTCHDREQSITIRDISAGGMKIQNAFGLAPGDTVRIELLTRRGFDGKVAWAVSPYCGIKFNTPLSETDPILTPAAPRETER
jgi:PilZ domain